MPVDRAALARRARTARGRQQTDQAEREWAGRGDGGAGWESREWHPGQSRYQEGDIERLPWARFLEEFTWRGGDGSRDAQHVTFIAKNRDGKSTLANEIEKATAKPLIVVWAAKPPGDPALERLKKQGYRHVQRWPWRKQMGVRVGPKLEKGKQTKILFWPKISTISDLPRVRPLFAEAMDDVFAYPWANETGTGWVERVDEGIYTCAPMFLGPACRHRLEDHWQRIASQDCSVEFLCQRASTVPLLAYDQQAHLFAARAKDRRDAERIGEMMGTDRLMVRDALAQLERFEFLWIDHDADRMAIIKAPGPSGAKR